MRVSKRGEGRSVYTEIGFWAQEDGSIHMTIKGLKNGHVTVKADPSRPNPCISV